MEHISYPKIVQFRNTISNLRRNVQFIGLDENENAIYDESIFLPKLRFKGTIKLHGTNASVCFNKIDGLYFQSRNKIITPLSDNARFANFANYRRDQFLMIMECIKNSRMLNENDTIIIYGEWAGNSIKKGVGISELEKAFYIFGIEVKDKETGDSRWLSNIGFSNNEYKIYNINNFETFFIDIDFNNPEFAQQQLIDIVEYVEKECPVAKSFGIKNGVGEGLVWEAEYKGIKYSFKTKGQKHSTSKVKKVASVNIEQVKSINAFVEYAVTDNRFNQALKEIYPDKDYILQKLGALIKWMMNDILTEELDVLNENGLEPKNVGGKIAQAVKQRFFKL